ncbi:MAG: adenylate/guanylate cyclase domain-containing protein [Flavobacteriia bacterium]
MSATKLTWEDDLDKSATRYHTYGAWIAIIFDPVFGLTDYLNIPHAFGQIMTLRISIAVITVFALLAHKRKLINSKMLIFIPFLLISLQNAYTYSVIQLDDFTGHSLNYLALFIGAGMFVLWNWYYSLAIIVPSILASGYFFQMNHHLNMQEALINGGLLLLVVAIFMFLLIETRYRLTISVIKFKIALVEANEALGDEKAQSDKLLRNILPDEVADELKTTGKASAKHYPKVSVLFTDFKGFTARSANMTPEEVIEELNKCFSAFDTIVEKYNLEKIKTIGDAYMCAGGLPVANETNPVDAIRAGLAIQEYMTAYKNECISKGEPYYECRLGINTGEVVAGVVGTKKFAYDIWGDTVNTASRAESTGALGKVNITESTYELVKDIFTCEYRGDIEVKGKGQMKMYFVLGEIG